MHVRAVPLLVLAAIAAGGALVEVPDWDGYVLPLVYWGIAAPAGLVLTHLWLRAVQRGRGIRPSSGSLVAITVLAALASLLGALALTGGLVVAVAFLVVAAEARNAPAAAAAVVFGVVVGLELPWHFVSLSVFANRVPEGGFGSFMSYHGTPAVLAALAIGLLAAGATTLRKHRTR